MRILLDLIGVPALLRRLATMRAIMRGVGSGAIHRSVRIGSGFSLSSGGRLVIGRGSNIRSNVTVTIARGGYLKIGTDVQIGYGVRISVPPSREMSIGSGSRINQDGILSGEIALGERCVIAPRVAVVSDSHNFSDPMLSLDENDRRHGMKCHQIRIGEDCFIGANALVFGPADIGPRAIVGAGTSLSGALAEGCVQRIETGAFARYVRRPYEASDDA